MKHLLLSSFLCLSAIALIAQNKWEFGLSGGASNYYGDFSPGNVVSLESKLAMGAFASYNIHPLASFRLNFLHGQIQGKDSDFPYAANQRERGFDFTNSFDEVSLLLVLEPFGKKYIRKKRFKRGISPYLAIGQGIVFSQPKTNFYENNRVLSPNFMLDVKTDQTAIAKKTGGDLLLCFGAGTKIFVSRRILLGFEAFAKPVFSDYLDGVSQAGNPKNKDWLVTGGLTLAYFLYTNPKDSDKDGTPDSKDECPDERGKKRNHGCPDANDLRETDTDGDGVPDKMDDCPNEPGHVLNRGCPDH